MPPPIPPAPVGTLMFKTPGPSLVIETFQDFCCPFSKKMFVTLASVLPALKEQGKSVDCLFQCVPQPWHAQSSYMHEAALAVKMLDESKFFDAAAAVNCLLLAACRAARWRLPLLRCLPHAAD